MSLDPHLGHSSQLSGVEELRIVGGKGDGMRLFQMRNAAGLFVTVSADRCADISRVSFKGDNMGYFSPCGYVAPSYYDKHGAEFLGSFTAGFFTTCGLTAVGAPCEDDGETLPLHGTIANTPCERVWWEETDDAYVLHAVVNDSRIFARKLVLFRTICLSKRENILRISDTVENQGDASSPLMLLYHMNMGYPLLSEHAVLEIPSISVLARDKHAEEDLDTWDKMLPPTPGFVEQCYYHRFDGEGLARIYNPDIKKGLELRFDTGALDSLTEWKMMGVHDYVLGLEPGNCTPDGRDVLRKEGRLKFIDPGEKKAFSFCVRFFE